jgi:hypothetical protein
LGSDPLGASPQAFHNHVSYTIQIKFDEEEEEGPHKSKFDSTMGWKYIAKYAPFPHDFS